MRFVCIASFLVLCLINFGETKPTANLFEGRGIGSTIWGWITYPFAWWSSNESELPPVNDQLVGPAPYGPYDNVQIAKHNVTVWCNEQTCTTMKCDKSGCNNVTCNIYDTDMRGECREYNMVVKPEEPVPVKPEPLDDKLATVKPAEVSAPVTTTQTNNLPADEHPLELEAVLSSTVTEGNNGKQELPDKTNKPVSPQNKI